MKQEIKVIDAFDRVAAEPIYSPLLADEKGNPKLIAAQGQRLQYRELQTMVWEGIERIWVVA